MENKVTDSPIFHRNVEVEQDFLNTIIGLEYVLLQRDWSNDSHGDIDLVVSASDWPVLVSAIIDFSKKANMPIVKVYEIEYAVICIILLMNDACIHLDVCVQSHKNNLFGVDLQKAILKREKVEGVYVVDENTAHTYKETKREYKNNIISKFLKKISNTFIICRRIRYNTIVTRSYIIYIPFLHDSYLLRFSKIIEHSNYYLINRLLPKYKK